MVRDFTTDLTAGKAVNQVGIGAILNPSMDAAARNRLATATTRLVRRAADRPDSDLSDDRYWSRIPQNERLAFAWRLSVEQWRLAGREIPLGPELRRHTSLLRRR